MVNIKNILIILSISIFLAIIFNYFNPKGITWFPEKEKFVSDSLLTSNDISEKIDDSNSEDFLSVSYQQVISKLDDPNVVFIDARPVEEYEEEKIGNAISCFPYLEPEDEYMRIILEEIPRDKVYIIYCHGGNCDLSHHVAKDMKAFGFEKIFIYTGGWEEWIKKRNI